MSLREVSRTLRRLRQSPLAAMTAMVTIALGVGASVAVFSVANAVLLRPLPYRDPHRLVYVLADLRARSVKAYPCSRWMRSLRERKARRVSR